MRRIWDGTDFLEVADSEAKRLVKEDKAQDITDLAVVDLFTLKYRRDFTGYHAEAAPEPPSAPAAAPEPPSAPAAAPPEAKSQEIDPMAKAVQRTPMKPWTSYKKATADALGKSFARTTKDDVMKWLEEQGHGAA